jgi:hypothetical protein
VIRIKTSITLREYLGLLLKLTYRKPVMIFILFVDVLVITWIILSHLDVEGIPEVTFFQYCTTILITIVQPIVICHTIMRNYQSSNHLQERIITEFTPEVIKIKGDSFYTELTWIKIYKVKELKNWYLIYQNNLSAILLCKSAFGEKGLQDFKHFLQQIPGLNLHLKEDK